MLRSILLLSLGLMVSCGTDSSATAPTSPPTGRTMSQRFNGPAIKQNANGEWPDDMQKTSAYDSNRKSAFFTEKSAVAKTYQTNEVAKTSWWGKKQLPKQAYSGNTDGNRFRTQSNIQHNSAHEATTPALARDAYPTTSYQTSTAREEGADRFAKPSDAETDVRRRVFTEPEVSGWKQQRAMDVKTTRSILGRD